MWEAPANNAHPNKRPSHASSHTPATTRQDVHKLLAAKQGTSNHTEVPPEYNAPRVASKERQFTVEVESRGTGNACCLSPLITQSSPSPFSFQLTHSLCSLSHASNPSPLSPPPPPCACPVPHLPPQFPAPLTPSLFSLHPPLHPFTLSQPPSPCSLPCSRLLASSSLRAAGVGSHPAASTSHCTPAHNIHIMRASTQHLHASHTYDVDTAYPDPRTQHCSRSASLSDYFVSTAMMNHKL